MQINSAQQLTSCLTSNQEKRIQYPHSNAHFTEFNIIHNKAFGMTLINPGNHYIRAHFKTARY